MRRALACSLAFLIAALVAGCGNRVDGEQARICREAITALNPDGTQLSDLRESPFALAEQGVRIDYLARPPGETDARRYVACGFAGRTFSPQRLDLVAVVTEGGA